jgi:hypothetical protein
MPKPRPLTKEQILAAMAKTKSNSAAARYLNCSYVHYKKWAIIEGRANASSFSPEKIKYRLIAEGYLEEKCAICGFEERRVLDYKMPLLLHFKDGNKKNYKLDNIELLCYNHYFLNVGDIFTDKQIEGIEDHKPVNQGKVDWEIDDYHLQRLKELGLGDDEENDFDIVSRI